MLRMMLVLTGGRTPLFTLAAHLLHTTQHPDTQDISSASPCDACDGYKPSVVQGEGHP